MTRRSSVTLLNVRMGPPGRCQMLGGLALMKEITRRQMLFSLPALAMAPRLFAQANNPLIRVRGINHVTLQVSDLKRSVDFYQGLFGMPVISRQGTTTVNLRIGNGPQFLGLNGGGGSTPNINHICLATENFNVERITK